MNLIFKNCKNERNCDVAPFTPVCNHLYCDGKQKCLEDRNDKNTICPEEKPEPDLIKTETDKCPIGMEKSTDENVCTGKTLKMHI